MASTVVVALRQAIVTGLSARTGLAGVQVTYGWPGDDLAERERIFCSRPRGTHTPASMRAGRTFRDEAGEIDVVIQVEMVGGSPEEADVRAIALGLQVEEWVADNTDDLTVPNLNWFQVGGWELNNLYNDRGSLTEITYTLKFRARLT